MPIVNVHCSKKAYRPDLLKKLGESLGEILVKALSVSEAKFSKNGCKIFFFENGLYDICDKDVVIYALANDCEGRREVIAINTKQAAEEIKDIIASFSWEGEPPRGFIYPFMGIGEVGEF